MPALSRTLTPATEAFMQEKAAMADIDQQAAGQDIVAQQRQSEQNYQKQLAQQEAASVRAQREQAAAQRAQLASAKKAGIKTTIDTSGSEQIQRHEDGRPVFEHGFQGEVQPDTNGHAVDYRTPRGETYKVPTKAIRSVTDEAGAPAYEFDLPKADGTKETVRQPVGSKPLWNTNPETGEMFTGAADPATGSYGQTKIGIDPVVAGKAAIKRQKDAFTQQQEARKFQSDELHLQQSERETNLAPLKTKLSDAEKAFKKLADDKVQYKQTPEGLVMVADYGGMTGTREQPVPSTDTAAIAKAQAWIDQRNAAEKALNDLKAEHDPLAAEVQTLKERRAEVALEALKAGRAAQLQLQQMEKAHKAGIPVHEPDWQKRIEGARTDPRVTDIYTMAELEQRGGGIFEDARNASLPLATQQIRRLLNGPQPQFNLDGSPVAEPGSLLVRPEASLANQIAGNLSAENGPSPQVAKDAKKIATEALGITDPENWQTKPTDGPLGERGYHDLLHKGQNIGSVNLQDNRIELLPADSAQMDAQQQRLINTNKNGLPVYFAGGQPPLPRSAVRDMIQQGVDISRSTTDAAEAETKLAAAKMAPADIRQRVLDGQLSVQDGRLLNETFHGIKDVDASKTTVTAGFGKHLSSPVLGPLFRKGDLAAKQQIANDYMDALAERASLNIIGPKRSELAKMRQELLASVDARSSVGKAVDAAIALPKNVIAPMAGMAVELLSAPYYGARKALGYKDEEADIIWNSSRDLGQRLVNTANPVHRMFGQGEMKDILGEVKSWADTAQPGDKLPDELDKKLSDAAYDGYFKFSDENARDVNTSRDTFSVNKTPALNGALQRYLKTADGSSFDQMLQLLSMTGNDRQTQTQTMQYLERPQVATADHVIDRAKLLDMALDTNRASAVLGLGKQIDAAKEPAQFKSLVTQAGKVLGLEKPTDIIQALSLLTREETDKPDSWRALFRAGTVADIGELGTEVASDVITGALTASIVGAPAGVAIKGAQVGARQGLKQIFKAPVSAVRSKVSSIIGNSMDALAEKSTRFATARASLVNAGTKFKELGITQPTFGNPLTTAQKVKNFGVGIGKAAVAAAPIEATEEGVAAMLEAAPTPQGLVDSMLMGAMGGTVLVPMFAGAQALTRSFGASARNQSITDFKAGLVDKFNDRMAGQVGFKPLTVDDFDIMQGIQDNPAQQAALADHAAALQELEAAQQEHTAAVMEMQDAAAGNAVADVPPSPRLLAAQDRAQESAAHLTDLASTAFSATDELRALPANERPLYTGIAKAASGATDYTEAEARALIGLGGESAVAFQQAQVLPADVSGPAQVTTLPGAPTVTQTGLGHYRLPPNVRVQVPPQAIAALAERAPSLRGLISTSSTPTVVATPATQAVSQPIQPSPAAKARKAATPTPQANKNTTASKTLVPILARGQPVFADPEELNEQPQRPLITTYDANGKRLTDQFGGQVNRADVQAINVPAAIDPKAAKTIENIARTVIGAVSAKSPKLKGLIKESKKPNPYPTGGMWLNADGSVAYHIPTLAQELAGLAPKDVAQRIAALLDEEIRHSANIAAAQRLHAQKATNPLGLPFDQWRDAWYGDIWNNHFTQEMRDKVQEAYGDTLPEQDWIRAMEGLRMLDQLRATNSITEAVLRALDAVLAALRDYLSLVTDGSRPIVQREIDAIASVLQEYGYEDGAVRPLKARKKAVKPQAAKKPQESAEKAVKTPKSSTQLTLSAKDAAPILAFGESIPKDELSPSVIAEDGTALEDEPHVTVLYGLTKHEAAPVAKTIAGHGPITVTLGKLSVFENDEYDVLKVDVESPELRSLNAKLSKLPNENSFPDYKPHMTVAYLKKGEGKKYVGDARFAGKTITFDTMTFSPPSALRDTLGKPELPLNSQAIPPATTNTNTTDENQAERQEGLGQGRQGQEVLLTEPAAVAPSNGGGSASSSTLAKIQSAFDGLASAPAGWSMVDSSNESAGNSASDVLQFEHVPTDQLPERLREDLEALGERWQKDAGATGKTSPFTRSRILAPASGSGRSLRSFLRAFEDATGKQIVWVDTAPDLHIPWKAAVSPSRPNTIFVHQRATANVLALVGHEWGHTLEAQDRDLYRELQIALSRFISKEDGRKLRLNLADRYRRKILNTEITNNIIGDFFTDPEFWREVEAENQGLLRQLLASVMQWFRELPSRLVGSEWGTENVLSDIAAARQATARVFSEALRRGPYSELLPASDDDLVRSDGLRSAPATTQEGLPKERRAAFLDVAESLIADGVETPAGLAQALMAARPDGSLAKYSQALWNFFGAIRPELTGQHDWNSIYSETGTPADQETDTPASAEAKVEEQVQTVAATGGQRDAKEIKKEIASALEKALKERDPAIPKEVTFSIPGDGTFTIIDTAENIEGLMKRVKRLPTEIKPDDKAPTNTASINTKSLAQTIERAGDSGDIDSWVINAANGDEWAMRVVAAVRSLNAGLVQRAESRIQTPPLASAPARGYQTPTSMLAATAATMNGTGPRKAPQSALFSQQPQAPQFTPRAMLDAYRAAKVGQSSYMLPIKSVFEKAREADPKLTPEAFMQQVAAMDAAEKALIGLTETQSAVDAARPFVLGAAGTEMAFPPELIKASAILSNLDRVKPVRALLPPEQAAYDQSTALLTPPAVPVLASAPLYPIAPQLNLNYVTQDGNASPSTAADDAKRSASNPLDQGTDVRAGGAQRFPNATESLLSWAKENGWLIDTADLSQRLESDEEIIGGDEHEVWADAATQRAIKLTIDNRFVQGTPFAYIQNLRRQNELFGTGYAFEGIADDNGEPRIVVSQPWVVGTPATKQAKEVYFASKGFVPASDDTFYSTERELLVTDTKPANVLQREDGTVQPIDVQIKEASGLASAPVQASSVTHQQDAEYMQAVKDGDVAKQQAMVDEAANPDLIQVGKMVRVTAKDSNGARFTFFAKPGSDSSIQGVAVKVFPEVTKEGNALFDQGDKTVQRTRVVQSSLIQKEDKMGLSKTYATWLPVKSADPITYDAEGNVIPLSQRFNPSRDSILYSAPAKPDQSARTREILDSMSPTSQNLLRDHWAGKSIEQIAKERSLSPVAVGNILRTALGRFEFLLNRPAPKVTVQVENGAVKAKGGRPDLALSGNAAVAAVDQRRQTPEEITHAEMQELASRMFAVDPVAAEKLVVRWMDSGTTVLSTDGMPEGIKFIIDDAQARQAAEMLMTAAAKMLVSEKALQGGNSIQLARLVDLYRNTGTEQARALNMRRDPFDTPEERAAMYLSEVLLTPPPSIRREMEKNPANKEKILAAWAAQADKIKAELLAAGIDLDATFREMAKEKKLAEATIPEPVKQPLARAPKKTRQLVKAVLEGKTWQEAMDAAGLTLTAAKAAYNGFRAMLNDIAAKAAAEARDALLRSAPAQVDFAAGIGLPAWTDEVVLTHTAVKTAATEKLKEQRERKKAGGEIDLKDPLSVNRARRLVEERKSNTFDKISEYWRASILSGPQTHVVNIVSGLTYGTYEATFKKMATGAQADIARMFGFKPDAASLADIPAMLAATFPAIQNACLDCIKSWKLETGLFDSYAMNLQAKGGGLFKEDFPPALKGKLGQIMRGISFRLMGAADEFVKSFFTRIEVAAQARQIARNEGKTGHEMSQAISELMEPGSLAWERALAQSKRITFQDEEVRIGRRTLQLKSPLQAGERAIDTLDHVSDLISRTKKGDYGSLLKGLSHFTFPFVSTPANIFKAGVTMSPVGGLLAIIDATRALHRHKKGNSEEASRIYNAARALDDMTNQIVAWGFILGLSALVKPGDDDDELPFITGTIPWRSTSPGEREIAYRTAPPQSIRIGDSWYSYKRLDPFASALPFTIDAIREFQSGKPIDEVWGAVGMGMLTNMQDKTFLQGVSDLVNAVQDPQRFGTKWATNIAIGFVPNLARQPARTSDAVFRENDLPNDMGFFEVLEHRVGFGLFPAASNPIAPIPAVDIWGREASKNTGTGGPNTDWLMRLFSPVEMRSAEAPDPLDVALLRYNMTHDQPFGVSAPSRELQKTIAGKPVKISLTDPEYLGFVTKAGKEARAALGESYSGRDLTENDVDAIKDIISKIQSVYRDQAFFAALRKRQATGRLN